MGRLVSAVEAKTDACVDLTGPLGTAGTGRGQAVVPPKVESRGPPGLPKEPAAKADRGYGTIPCIRLLPIARLHARVAEAWCCVRSAFFSPERHGVSWRCA